jgi:hypothetical protein
VRDRGGVLIEVNPYETEITPLSHLSLRATSGVALPALVERVRAARP